MLLTIAQAASQLGKSERQIRYLIQAGQIEARKLGGRWVIDSAALPLSTGQERAQERKARQLRAAVEEGLGLDKEATPARFSVRDLKAFQLALPIHQAAIEALGAEHPVAEALHTALVELSRGCHRFEASDKANAYRAARDAASLAVCELLLSDSPAATALVDRIEQELMAALAGLLRRLERRHH
jgi:excisionase family DNA binding protein